MVVEREKQKFQLMAGGRADFAIASRIHGWVELRTLFPDRMNDFKVAGPPERRSSNHFLISKSYPKHDEIAPAISKALQRMIANGKMDEIFLSYGIPYTKALPGKKGYQILY